MFCNIFSKLFGKKEKDVDKIEDKKLRRKRIIIFYYLFSVLDTP